MLERALRLYVVRTPLVRPEQPFLVPSVLQQHATFEFLFSFGQWILRVQSVPRSAHHTVSKTTKK